MRGDGRLRQFPRKSPYWYAVYFIDGREITESTGKTDRQQAERVLRKKVGAAQRGEAIPHESRVTLGDLLGLLRTDYTINRRRSLKTLGFSLAHLIAFFGETARAVTLTTDRLRMYVAYRQSEGAANATVNIELALLGRAFTLAVQARQLGRNRLPHLPKLAQDESRVRQGFFSREEVEALVKHLPATLGDLVLFLFYSAWRVGEVRTLEWRDYDRVTGVVRLRAEQSKNKRPRVLPVDTGELAAIIERRQAARRLDCPYVFHQHGRRIGDFRKAWRTACKAVGMSGRIVHDLRRSGVRHLIDAGNDPHTVMAFSGHRTDSMLKRYHVINVDDLRRAAERGSAYTGRTGRVVPLRTDEVENPEKTRRAGSET